VGDRLRARTWSGVRIALAVLAAGLLASAPARAASAKIGAAPAASRFT